MLLVFLVGSASAEVKKYVFGSGPMGGPGRIGVGAAVQVLNEQLKQKYFFTAASSGGSVENMRRLIGGEFQTAWVHINTVYEAWNGVGLFEGEKPFKDVRVIEFLTDQALCIATLAKSNIRNLSDLAGKKINIGPPGSGGVPIAKALFKALNIEDKVKIVYISFDAGAQAMKDGQIDVSITPGGPVTPPIAEIARSVSIRLIEPTPLEVQKIESAMPFLYVGMIPPHKAPGENADKERKAFFWSMYWCALSSMPNEVVYDMLTVTQEPKTKEMLGKVLNYWSTAAPEFSSLVKMRIPIHPGAVKYWMEQGIKLDKELIK